MFVPRKNVHVNLTDIYIPMYNVRPTAAAADSL